VSKVKKGKKSGSKSMASPPPAEAEAAEAPSTHDRAHGAIVTGQEDWSVPSPAAIPPPTFWPAGLAFGLTLTLWGFVTSIVIVLLGLLAAVVSLVGWIGDMRHEAEGS
jgi:hypothetical protein